MMKQVVDGVWYYPLTAVQRTHDETPVLISGFRLFHAACIAQTAGDLLIPVVLHPGSPDDPATWELALSHIGIAEHTPHEIAAFLRMANRRGGIETERAMRIIPGLVHHELAAAIRSAARLSRGTLKRHQREAIDIRKSAEIAAFLPSERAWITCLTCRLTRMSLSRLRRCADLMRDLSLRESLSILEIARAVARDIRANQGVDDPACSRAATRAEDLLAELECRRSPERYRMTEQFETIVRS
ncbi:hypothetical protein JXA80_01075, partial [bacterium]|nr:hypothetical protein [candidate division CSSED10-310 bacterium]